METWNDTEALIAEALRQSEYLGKTIGFVGRVIPGGFTQHRRPDGSLLPANQIYVRIDSGRQTVPMYTFKQYVNNVAVICAQEQSGEWFIERLFSPLASDYLGNEANQGEQPIIGEFSPLDVSPRQFIPGRVERSNAGGLNVKINDFWHNGRYYPAKDPYLLTPTSTSGAIAYVVLYFDPRTETYHQTIAPDFALTEADCANRVPQGCVYLDAVKLTNGATSIPNTTDTFISARNFLDEVRPRHKYDATGAPTSGDDAADGWSVGSWWFDITHTIAYRCDDATPTAAVWRRMVHLNVAGEIAGLTEKTTPHVDDWLLIEDSEASNVKKKVKIDNLPGGGGGDIGVSDGTTTVDQTTDILFDGTGFEVNDLGSGMAGVVRKSSDAQVSISPQAYIVGFEVDYDGTDLTIAPGEARASSDDYTLILTSPVTINPATTGANGLDTGSLANDTFYYVWVIANSSTNATAGLLSASSTSPTMPSGYDRRRRVGAMLTDGSAALYRIRTVQGSGVLRDVYYLEDVNYGAPFELYTEVNVGGGTAYSFSDVDCSSLVPPTSRFVLAYVSANSPGSGPGARLVWREKGVTSQVMPIVTVPATSSFGANVIWLPLDSGQVGQWAATSTFDEDGAFSILGYRDNLTPTIVGTSSPDVETTGGAPLDATYVVEDANGSLTNEVLTTTLLGRGALSSLPASTKAGRKYHPTDALLEYYDTGAGQQARGLIRDLTPPVLGDTSWFNQGTATIADEAGGVLLTAPLATPPNLRARQMTAPTPPYTLTAAFAVAIAGAGDGLAGLLFRDGSSGLLHTFGWSGQKFVISKYNNAASFNSNYTTDDMWLTLPLGLIWMQIADTGANRACRVSADGVTFINVHTVGNTDFLTATQIGYFAQAPVNTGNRHTQMWLVHWSVT